MHEGHYIWNAEDYADHSTAQFTWAREMIGKLNLRGSESVLDIGCGDGKVTALIASFLARGNGDWDRQFGIDDCPCTEEVPLFDVSQPFHLSRLMRRCSLLADQFELAFSNAALHWIPDQGPVLRGVRAALKPSGRIFFQMGGRGNARDILAIANRHIREKRWRSYFSGFSFPYRFFSPEEYEVLLREAGFIPKRLELIPKDMTQKGREGFAGWIRTTWLPYMERIPEQKRDLFVSDLIDAYLGEFPMDKEGLVHTRMVRLEVEAVKE